MSFLYLKNTKDFKNTGTNRKLIFSAGIVNRKLYKKKIRKPIQYSTVVVVNGFGIGLLTFVGATVL